MLRARVLFSCILRSVVVLATVGTASAQEGRLPPKVDLRHEFVKLGITPHAQFDRDVCSLFAITGVADFEYARAHPLLRKRLSEEFLIWAANEATGKGHDQAMFYEAVAGLNAFGTCAAELMPYDEKSDPNRGPLPMARADAKERSHRWCAEWIKRWDVDRPLSEAQLIAIKRALAHGHPVACGLRWPKTLKGAALIEVPPPRDVRDGHSIAFTGYEDDPGKKGGGVFYFRNSFGPRWGNNGYGTMSYAYARAYANDALWLKLGAPGSEVPIARYEAEAMPVLARDKCETTPQNMSSWGRGMWSRGEQLFCRAQHGGSVELGFDVSKPGRFRLRVLGTAGPDFGIIRVALDGKVERPHIDLYSGRVCPAGSLELGIHDLAAGRHRLRFTAVGKDPASKNFSFGLDAVDLLAPHSG